MAGRVAGNGSTVHRERIAGEHIHTAAVEGDSVAGNGAAVHYEAALSYKHPAAADILSVGADKHAVCQIDTVIHRESGAIPDSDEPLSSPEGGALTVYRQIP